MNVPVAATLETLLKQLGWAGEVSTEESEFLAALLNDEFAALPADGKETFSKSLVNNALTLDCLDCCPSCQVYSMPRYRLDSGRCRECGAFLSAEFQSASENTGIEIHVHSSDQSFSDAGFDRFQLASDRSLVKVFGLASDNPSWSDREQSGSGPEQGSGAIQAQIEEELSRRLADEKKRWQAEAQEANRKMAADFAAQLDAVKAGAESRAEENLRAKLEKERLENEAKLSAATADMEVKAAELAQAKEQERVTGLEDQKLQLEAAAQQQLQQITNEAEEREEERRRREAKEAQRPSLGCLTGPRAGKIIKIPALPDVGAGADTAVYLLGEGRDRVGRLFVKETMAYVNSKEVALETELDLTSGSILQIGSELFVYEELSELEAQVPEAIHFVRNDGKPGGPWPYWNEELTLGSSGDCAINLVDDEVFGSHARIVTRFGRILVEDLTVGNDEAGLFYGGRRYPWLVLVGDSTFRLGDDGPELKVVKGEARVKKVASALAMKPSRHKRTLLELRNVEGDVIKKIFLFTRREVRFGNRCRDSVDGSRMINEWVIYPSISDRAEIGEKQGALVLTRSAVDLRWDGGDSMTLNDLALEHGRPVELKRQFHVTLGETISFDGRAYRSPSSVVAHRGPAGLGMKGGHPFECVRFDRNLTDQSFFFLVRMIRIGSEAAAPLCIDMPGVEPHHCQIMFSQGKFQIVAPRSSAPVYLGDLKMDPGAVFPLEINTKILIGEASLVFREVRDRDFKLS
jgi:hypothetical protein